MSTPFWERMGSGGPRGLQILVSGTFGVRGGFDSHAFPPSSHHRPGVGMRATRGVVVLLLAALAAGPARAQSPSDSLRAPRLEEVGGKRTPAVAAKPDSARRLPWHEQPRFVMARSLVIPGWGQAHNHAWFKALAVAGIEGYYGSRIVQDQRALDRLFRQINETEAARLASDDPAEQSRLADLQNQLANDYNARLDLRLGRQWLLGAALAYALVDAYVDANFRGFDVEFQNDPALPAGAPPVPTDRGDRPGVRLFLRRHF